MGLREALRRTGTRHPAVLPAVHPGGTETRLAVEAGLRRRGWPVAASPAAASALLVVGAGGAGAGEWTDALWRQIPYPKSRSTVTGADGVETALDGLLRTLAAPAGGSGGGMAGDVGPGEGAARGRPGAGHGAHDDHGGHESPRGPRGREDHRGHGGDEPGHEGHESHDGHESAGTHERPGGHGAHDAHAAHLDHAGPVAGLPMAERADDRDGLRLDRLHLPLGPGLTDWPAGLVLDVALQGDVVQHAEVRTATPAAEELPYWDEPWLRAARGEDVVRGAAHRRCCAAHLDSIARLLAVSGWPDPAVRARRLRDAVLGGSPAREWSAGLGRLGRRVRRSRVLRASTAGLGALPAARARRSGVTGPALAADGDAYDRLLTWLGEAMRHAAGVDDDRPLAPYGQEGPRGRLDGPRPPSRALLDVLPDLLRGAEFTSARVIVASLDPDLDELAVAVCG
ncbi:hypothetical protein DMB38_32095 [Streptomyces sp. WAC 06738]|uniref:DUF4779 domain-containing protein n=1 Tax=Streptomyces sp. WAC 06738 TaxID=2203210 RepID=UPI000F6F3540|nr:DUF4779 domain-containing protein [Streptomyces sp. WAC 06738]AZM49806.1 hypothetical protein DMB38_32095 [Streptomyces sp. WAC 06738]